MTGDATATFPLNAAAVFDREQTVKLAADKEGFSRADEL
jgi:hypothetical protein